MSESNESGPTVGIGRQMEIYQGALTGRRPLLPLNILALESKARELLKPEAYDYVAGGAGAEKTMQANLAAFDRIRIAPRILRDVAKRDLTVSLFGRTIPSPILLAPIGVQGIVHPEGEIAVGRAAASLGIPFILSTLSSHSIESVAEAMGSASRWFQLYCSANPEINRSLISRAERAGYSAVVVTLDTHTLGWRERDLQHGYLPFMTGEGLATYFSDPVFRSSLDSPPESDPGGAVRAFLACFSDSSLTWDDLAVLRDYSNLPILLKGILRSDDAARALDSGADGIIVSNHGGRQVDGAIGALDALPEVAREVNGRTPVLFDSGIRRGADVFKALALGADAVLLGRPYAWGLAVAGESGVREVLQNLMADFDLCVGLTGCASLADVEGSMISSR